MDYFVELSSSEDSNECDFSKEAEVALYGSVHHSKETYGTDSTTEVNLTNNYFVSKRNKALRWNSIKNLGDSTECLGTFSNFQQNNQKGDFMPLGECSVGRNANNMYNKSVNMRETWKNKNSIRPWNNRSKVPYIRNLVSVNIDVSNNSWEGNSPIQEINLNSTSPKKKLNENPQVYSHSEKISELSVEEDVLKGNRQESEISEENSKGRLNLETCVPVNESKKINQNLTPFKKVISHSKHECVKELCAVGNEPNASKISISGKIDKSIPNLNTGESNNQNAKEILTISDSEDNDSIVEVSVPPKPNPPVIALDSSDEGESIRISTDTLLLNVKPALDCKEDNGIHEDIILNDETTTQSNDCNNDINTLMVSHQEISMQVKQKEKRKKKKKERTKCVSWADSMDKFYNKSWGGETFDHVQMQQKMSNNPTKWQILDIDKYGPMKKRSPLARARCANCNQFGHLAKDCSDPKKVKSCFMCGMQGHKEFRCPYKMCLKCGRPAPMFNSGCPLCWSKDHPTNCTTCGDREHFSWMCPSVWRKLHSITSTKVVTTIDVQFSRLKPNKDLSCCHCAGQGHSRSGCPFLSRSMQKDSNSQTNPFFPSPHGRKRKKINSYFEGNKRQDRKRRKIH